MLYGPFISLLFEVQIYSLEEHELESHDLVHGMQHWTPEIIIIIFLKVCFTVCYSN